MDILKQFVTPSILVIMEKAEKVIDNFLNKYGMHPDAVDLDGTVSYIIEEMKNGLAGEKSSLAMIPTYIEVDAEIKEGEKVVVLDAGGTNLRAAKVFFSSDGKPVIEDFSKQPMPGTDGNEVSADDFFSSLANLVKPLITGKDKIKKIGFCFSYPTEIFPDKDGQLIHWTKEVKAPEVVGKKLGENLKKSLKDTGVSNPPEVILLNDTVATLLTGKISQKGRKWGGYSAIILGTGTNTCYVESNKEIGKAKDLDPSGSQVINCETGSLTLPCRGRADELLGLETENPDAYWLEKMLSGRYFGLLTTKTVQLAVEDNIFSDKAAEFLKSFDKISTKDADNFVHNPVNGSSELTGINKYGIPLDAEYLWHIIDKLLERAAKLTAANLAATILKGKTEDGPLNPACLTIDGTTYYRYYRFSYRVDSYLHSYLQRRDKFYEFIKVEDAPLIGAAVAALTN